MTTTDLFWDQRNFGPNVVTNNNKMDSQSGGGGGPNEGLRNMKRVIYHAFLSHDFCAANCWLEATPPPPAALLEWLRELRVGGQPLLHYLAGKPVSDGGGGSPTTKELALDRFVELCVQAGLDTEQLGTLNGGMSDCTALVGAIHAGNGTLAESLVRWGGTTSVNFRDGQGRCATHASILKNNLKLLRFLVEHGGADLRSTPEELAGSNGIHPPLHTAIDLKRKDIVGYLISKKDLVDVNEVAVYSLKANSPVMSLFSDIHPSGGSEEAPEEDDAKVVSVTCSPIGRAILSKKCQLVEILLMGSNATLQGFRELDFCLRNGHSKMAALLLRGFGDEAVRDHRMEQGLSLECFPDETSPRTRNKFMKGMIIKNTRRVRTGIPVGALVPEELEEEDYEMKLYKVCDCSILHMAAASGDKDLVKAVVAKGAAELINCLSGVRGNLQCSPLHLAIILRRWDLVGYLVEQGSDLELEGCVTHPLNPPTGFTHVVRPRMRDCEDQALRFGKFNALELLLQLGFRSDDGGAPVLEKMLMTSGRVGLLHGAEELHLAVDGGNVEFAKKVLQAVQKGGISPEDLHWIRVWGNDEEDEVRREPLFQHLVANMNDLNYNMFGIDLDVGQSLVEFLEALIPGGYDCSAVGDGGESQLFPVLHAVVYFGGEGLLLLNTFLNSGNHHQPVEINVRNKRGESPVGYLLREWNSRCSQDFPCPTRYGQPDVFKILKLLLLHGADVSGLEIGPETTKYHWGYGALIKLLYSAGAKGVKAEFFEDSLCDWCGHPASWQQVHREVGELREWVSEEGEKMRLNLNILCRAAIRSSVRRVGDLQKLDRLAPKLRDYVAMKEDLK